ncbi:MAG: hypothetical protein FJ319_12725 [SAR202 cluster bacterium]|nr:hypothetical protein [SAR202 cluster bacterium]
MYLGGGTVLFDEQDGIFKMWYRTDSVDVTPRKGRYVDDMAGNLVQKGGYKSCYAVSRDGIEWEKPSLGLTEFAGSTQNNILPPAKAFGGWEQLRRPSIIKDYLDPDPSRRYKMLYMDKFDAGGGDADVKWGLVPAYSADGIRWRMLPEKAYFPAPPSRPNGVLFGWDPLNEQFVHYHRESTTLPADVDGRTVRSEPACLRTASDDFESWSGTVTVIRKGLSDPPGWSCPYLDGVLYTPDLYIGFLATSISNQVEDAPASLLNDVYKWESGNEMPELVYSRNGVDWTRAAPLWPAHRKGLWGTWDSEWVMVSKPIVHGDRMMVYYTGSNVPAKAHRPDHPQQGIISKRSALDYNGQAIGLAVMRRDGFVSMEAYEQGGTFTTKPVVCSGDRLIINARAPERPAGLVDADPMPYGRLTVELLEPSGAAVAGRARDDCDAFTGDAVDHTVTWRDNFDVSRLAGQTVRLRFHLRNAEIYAFQFRTALPERDITNLHEPGSRGHV